MTDRPESLATLLAAAEAALDRGEPLAAEAAVADAARLCARLAADGVALDPASLPALRAQHARLAARAALVRDDLARQLDAAGRSRRAAAAYQSR